MGGLLFRGVLSVVQEFPAESFSLEPRLESTRDITRDYQAAQAKFSSEAPSDGAILGQLDLVRHAYEAARQIVTSLWWRRLLGPNGLPVSEIDAAQDAVAGFLAGYTEPPPGALLQSRRLLLWHYIAFMGKLFPEQIFLLRQGRDPQHLSLEYAHTLFRGRCVANLLVDLLKRTSYLNGRNLRHQPPAPRMTQDTLDELQRTSAELERCFAEYMALLEDVVGGYDYATMGGNRIFLVALDILLQPLIYFADLVDDPTWVHPQSSTARLELGIFFSERACPKIRRLAVDLANKVPLCERDLLTCCTEPAYVAHNSLFGEMTIVEDVFRGRRPEGAEISFNIALTFKTREGTCGYGAYKRSYMGIRHGILHFRHQAYAFGRKIVDRKYKLERDIALYEELLAKYVNVLEESSPQRVDLQCRAAVCYVPTLILHDIMTMGSGEVGLGRNIWHMAGRGYGIFVLSPAYCLTMVVCSPVIICGLAIVLCICGACRKRPEGQ